MIENSPNVEIPKESVEAVKRLQSEVNSRISELFYEFTTAPVKEQLTYFDTKPGSKLNDYICLTTIMYSKFLPTEAIDICFLYSNGINQITAFPYQKLIFFSHIVQNFDESAIIHLPANINNILMQYLILIHEVAGDEANKGILHKVFSISAKALNLAMKNEVQIAGFIATWIQNAELDEPFLLFLKHLKWPLIQNHDGAKFIIETIIGMIINLDQSNRKLETVVTECAVSQILSLKGYPNKPILKSLPVLESQDVNVFTNMRAVATFALYTLLNNKVEIIDLKSFAILVRLLSNGIEFSPDRKSVV